MDWYAIRTKTAKENATRILLEDRGFTVFLPMIKGTRRSGPNRNRTECEFAYYPGYLFAQVNGRWPDLMAVSCVVSVVGFDGKPQPLRPQIIEQIARQCAAYVPQKPAQRVKVGDKVRITEGPLELQTAIVEEVKGPLAKLDIFKSGHTVVDMNILQVA